MIRGTTPDFILTVNGYDLTNKTVYVTIKQEDVRLTKTGDELSITTDGNDSIVAFMLTQQDTLQLHVGKAEIQIRFIGDDQLAYATKIAEITVDKVLLERVIAYG